MTVTEQAFQATVVDLCHRMGYRTMHVRRTIGKGRKWTTGTSVVGWPDLTIYGNGETIYAEIKTDTGKLSREQVACIDDLRAAGNEVHVWRPTDWTAIEERLTRHARARARQPIVRSAR